MNVWILAYDHKHGNDISVYATADLAYAALYEIVRYWWDDVMGTPIPDDHEEAIETYFDKTMDSTAPESWEISEQTVQTIRTGVTTHSPLGA